MKKFLAALVFTMLTLLISSCCIFTNCSTDNDKSKVITVNVYLTDKPLSSIKNLWVDINKVYYSIGISDAPASVVELETATTVDVLSLAGASTLLFKIENVEEGESLLWIKLDITAATMTVEDSTYTLGVSTPEEIIIDRSLGEGDSFVLDFDLSRSIVEVGHSDIYELRPEFNWWRSGYTSSVYYIKGKVVDSGGDPVQGAALFLLTSDESTIVRFTLSGDDGSFRFDGVSDGTYIVAVFGDFEIPQEDSNIMCLMKASDTSEEININAGNKEDVTIVLP